MWLLHCKIRTVFRLWRAFNETSSHVFAIQNISVNSSPEFLASGAFAFRPPPVALTFFGGHRSRRRLEGVRLTLPPHIFSVKVKSGACQWGRFQNKRNLTLTRTFYYIVNHDFYFIIFTAYFLYEEVMSDYVLTR